jgi:hypothetical protein
LERRREEYWTRGWQYIGQEDGKMLNSAWVARLLERRKKKNIVQEDGALLDRRTTKC